MKFEVLHEIVEQGLAKRASLTGALYDISEPQYGVQVVVGPSEVWVNIAGVCVLRVARAPLVELDDIRERVAK